MNSSSACDNVIILWMEAEHMLNYHALTLGESESGAEFVDRALREYLALRDMGVPIDDSISLTKFMQQDTTNTKHKPLAQTIFTTPKMTLGCAASLFETYNPPSGPAAVPTTPTVNAVICGYYKQRKREYIVRLLKENASFRQEEG